MKGLQQYTQIVEDSSSVKWVVSGSFTSGESLSWSLEEKPDKIFLQGQDSPVYYYSVLFNGYDQYNSSYFPFISSNVLTSDDVGGRWYITNSDYANYYGYFYWNEASKTLEARFTAWSSYYSPPTSPYTITSGKCEYIIIKEKD